MPFRKFKGEIPHEDFAPQESAFLNLPAELRNTIYECVCLNVHELTILPGPEPKIVETEHSLSRTCRQLHAEFTPLYLTEAPRNAGKLVCHLRNFERKNKKIPMLDFLEGLPPLPSGAPRTFEQRLYIDNTFERASIFNCSNELPYPSMAKHVSEKQRPVNYTIIASFDSRNFDVEYLRQYLNRFMEPSPNLVWPLYWALRHAIDRHYQARDEKSKARARKQRLNARKSGRDQSEKKVMARKGMKT